MEIWGAAMLVAWAGGQTSILNEVLFNEVMSVCAMDGEVSALCCGRGKVLCILGVEGGSCRVEIEPRSKKERKHNPRHGDIDALRNQPLAICYYRFPHLASAVIALEILLSSCHAASGPFHEGVDMRAPRSLFTWQR
ncbi:hypothetical protein P171DRAFT_183335 [Karstenula rhodostoma CBS 690.94]|uniref:Uncharacterized protein n=1 Tax=Karstenula rhodostoma CBS 690.94 TaxID=1392251 RepID=A0A9P4U415_9PLEO|nr:hypothetical protein P171DRAFT_183335 [Karstenula rhodostoma CBS 690.94]